jgi:hypothetical protein
LKIARIAGTAKKCQNLKFSPIYTFGNLWQFRQSWQFLHPIPKSAANSSGVPQTRQITAEQSPQISGSVTSRAQLGQ